MRNAADAMKRIEVVAQDRRNHRRHRRDRVPDQPAGAQRRGRGGARRRCGPRLRRGGGGSARPGAAGRGAAKEIKGLDRRSRTKEVKDGVTLVSDSAKSLSLIESSVAVDRPAPSSSIAADAQGSGDRAGRGQLRDHGDGSNNPAERVDGRRKRPRPANRSPRRASSSPG